MGMKGDKIPQLAIYDPSGCTVGVFAFDSKDGFMLLQWMQTITDPDAKTMEKEWDSSVALFIPLKP
jgi:hypothetical protein